MSDLQNPSWNYREFLLSFKTKGYDFVFFHEIDKEHGQIALRHDIDFDTEMAHRAAIIENELGIRSTFFFLLRSEFYNIFSATDHANILAIKALGHKISIHFDTTIYDDFKAGLQKEKEVFRTLFDEDVNIISLHRPNEFFLQYDEPILDIEHTYLSKYFRKIKYFADSTGAWRYGYPLDSDEVAQLRTIHLLTHPIWWMVDGHTNLDKLKTYFAERVGELNDQFCLNCIPFRDIRDQV